MPNKNRQAVKRVRLIIIIFVVLFFIFVSGLIKETINKHRIDSQISKLEQEIFSLEQNNQELAGNIESWSQSNQLEKQARLKLGLKKPGETAVIISREGDTIGLVETFGPPPKEVSNPQKWFNYFLGK